MKQTTRTIHLYLLLIAALWIFCFLTLTLWLQPCSIAYEQTGQMTPGYFAYSAIGLLFSTPAPFVSVLILALWHKKPGLPGLFRRILRTENVGQACFLTALFCLPALLFALGHGQSNGSPWYRLPLGFLIMIPFVGIAEETGWRGLLQPALERRLHFPFSVLLVAAIWYIWHLDLWLDPSSNHYGDSLPGFGITILIWSFALAALYKATGSVLACAVYHAFIDSLGAVWDWNALFDPFPGDPACNAFRLVWLLLSLAVWLWADRREKQPRPTVLE